MSLVAMMFAVGLGDVCTAEERDKTFRSRSGGSATSEIQTTPTKSPDESETRAMLSPEEVDDGEEREAKQKVRVYRSRTGGSAMMGHRKEVRE